MLCTKGTVPFSRWYITGDVAAIDEDGFITITGRISRFSKLAGEMVPHIRVEEAIGQVLDSSEDDLKVVVTSVPDPKKGERLVVLYTELQQTPEQICRRWPPADCRRYGFPRRTVFAAWRRSPCLARASSTEAAQRRGLGGVRTQQWMVVSRT